MDTQLYNLQRQSSMFYYFFFNAHSMRCTFVYWFVSSLPWRLQDMNTSGICVMLISVSPTQWVIYVILFSVFYSYVGIAVKNANGTFVAPSVLPAIDLRTLSSQFASITTQSGVRLSVANITTTGSLFRYSLGFSFYLDQVVPRSSTSSVLSVVQNSLPNSECSFLWVVLTGTW